ncbi:MAG: DUF1566 domain-containing protein [Bacteroidales bacterium]|nr:DUF1566 domain-containing protein [Bacteroidales bacterium]
MQKKEIHIKLILLILSMFLLLSCDSKNEEVFNGIFSKNGSLATILTTPATSVTDTSAEAGGNLTDNGSTYIIARGICWGTDQNPDTSDFTIETGKEPGEFVCSITGLSKGTLYYMRAYVSNNIGTAYGNQETFTTLNIPTITTASISNITDTTAISGGNITADGGVNITARGVCWSTKQNPTIADTISKDGSGKGIFTSSLKKLVPNTTYYVKAWATNSIGTAYGNELAFTTTSPAPVLPSITTTTISAITQSSAVSGGNITSNGGATVTSSGICWGTSPSPTIALTSKTTDGLATGAFAGSLTGLTANTTYYIRSYATNSVGTAYGNEISFTTLPATGGTVTDIDGNVYNTVTIGTQIWMKENLKTTRYRDGSIIPYEPDKTLWYALSSGAYCWYNNDQATYKETYGGLYNFYATVDNRNLCPNGWHVPTNAEWTALTDFLGGTSVSGGKLKEAGTSHWLNPNTGATNETGFAALPGGYRYNPENYTFIGSTGFWWSSTESSLSNSWLRFLSSDNPYVSESSWDKRYGYSVRCIQGEGQVLAAVSTTNIVSITQTTASTGGIVNNNGGSPVTATGICWSTFTNPTIALSTKTSDVPAAGVFISSITGLNANTTYYVRAYATNSVGTAYGNEQIFSTSAPATYPTLSTTAISSITPYSASGGGNISSDGGSSVVSRGVCWNLSPAPTINNFKSTDGSGIGNFASNITTLNANTTYYVRAYATNSAGTAYGNEISFTTLPATGGTVTDIDGNTYNTVIIGTQTWMRENLKTTRYSDGIAISNVTDNSAWSLLTSGAYCWWVNDQATYKATYGALYNYYAIDNKNLCPIGWHVPTHSEWTTLTSYLGGESIAGSKLKETGNTHWMSYNTDATNESGFTAIPGGYRVTDGNFMNLGAIGYWWSSTDFSGSSSWGRLILHINTMVSSNYFNKVSGFSVRCLQGETVVLPGIMTTNPTVYNTSVSTGGNLLTTGGGVITDMGVCWSTSPNVTISSGSKSSAGTTALGFFTIPIPSLTPLTTYYIKAYATNSAGTGYGVEFSFTTGDGLPSVSTTSISGISNTSASSGGTITTLGNVSANTRGVCWSTTTNPTIANSKTTDGSGAGIFTSSITGLSANTTYYVRAYATNIVGTAYGNEISFTTLSQSSGTVTDIDGNVYNTVIIGTQIWMKENLKTTKYRDGSSVQNVTDNTAWSLLTSGAYCWLLNDQATYKASYGAIYNYYAFENRNLCPTGWHVPTESEWTTLTSYLGGENIAGGKLKEAGTDHWQTPNTGATNETAFTALPGGYRAPDLGLFYSLGSYGYWASSTEKSLSLMWGYYLNYNNSFLFSLNLDKRGGYSVRCLQGEPAPLAVGDNYKGGKIAYIFQPGDNGYVVGQVHGLIAAPGDQSTGAEWGCNGTNLTGADSTGLGKGNQNTIDIVTGCATAGTAAKICSDLVLSGYSDWYLPSRDELNKLYLNQSAIGGFSTSVYWSSSEYNEFAASTVAFGPGGISNVFKYETHYVRAVRSF